MEMKLKLFANFIDRDETEGDAEGDAKAKVQREAIPSRGFLGSMKQSYLPISASSRVMLYLKVAGYRKAEKHVIRIEGSGKKLMTQQGLYTCPAYKNNTLPFNCCLEVQETVVKMQDPTSHGMQTEVFEYSLIFHPTLTIQNLLPIFIEGDLTLSPSDQNPHSIHVEEGEAVPVHDFDLTKTVKWKAHFHGFETVMPLDLKPSPKAKHQVSTVDRRVRFHPTNRGFMLGNHFLHLKHLELTLRESYIGMSGARKVTVFCPCWILNKTEKEILIKDRKSNFVPHVTARPLTVEDDWSPVLFSTSRSTAYIAVSYKSWSKTIYLNSVGFKDSVFVLAPCEAEEEENGEIVFPHGVVTREHGFKSFTQFLSPGVPAEDRELPRTPSKEEVLSEDEDKLPPVLKSRGPRFSRLDFSISVHLGPGDFDLVKVLRICPRYVLYNHSTERLQIGQKGTKSDILIDPGTHIDYYWHDSEAPQEICIRPANATWCYSGGFRLDEVNDFGLRIRNARYPGMYRIFQVDVSFRGDSMICAFSEDEENPPYRIDNR